MKTSVVKVQIADGATVFLPGRRRPVSFLGLVSHLVLDVAQIPLLAQSSDPEVLKLSAMRIVVDRSKLLAVATLLHCGANTTADIRHWSLWQNPWGHSRRDSLHSDDDFPLSVPLSEIADGLRRLAERVRSIDDRCDLPGFNEILQNN